MQRQKINSLIYLEMERPFPTRCELMTYSKKRVFFYQELQTLNKDEITLRNHFNKFFTEETDYKKDNISHFICRLLFCQNQHQRANFLDYQRKILEFRLKKFGTTYDIQFLASILSELVQEDLSKYLLTKNQKNNTQLWRKILQGYPISPAEKKNLDQKSFMKLPFDMADYCLKRRRAYVSGGFAYVSKEALQEIIINQYSQYLKTKIVVAEKELAILLQQDSQKQIYSFLTETLDKINQASYQEMQLQNNQKLTLKNVQVVWKKYFPPCMLVLTEALKAKSHLRHEGRRQLWLFFKACGMSSLDNQQFFRRHMAHKVSDSDMKSHIYNIQHAYGQVGKRQPQHPKICRNIITGPAPKKQQYHGCPFRHWSQSQLGELLRRKYQISEQKITDIMKQKSENHFQVACGRLFEAQHGSVPEQILNQLGKSPQSFYNAGMQLNQKKKDKKHMDIQLHKTAQKMQVEEMF